MATIRTLAMGSAGAVAPSGVPALDFANVDRQALALAGDTHTFTLDAGVYLLQNEGGLRVAGDGQTVASGNYIRAHAGADVWLSILADATDVEVAALSDNAEATIVPVKAA